MSIRSAIGLVAPNGVRSIYVHLDGYPQGVGKILKENYNDIFTINKLMDLGDLSVLGKVPVSDPKLWDLDTSPDYLYSSDKCRAYKDRGEVVPAVTFKDEEEFRDSYINDVDYIYLFKDGQWLYMNGFDMEEFEPLTSDLFENLTEAEEDENYIVTFNHFSPEDLFFVKNVPANAFIYSDYYYEDITDQLNEHEGKYYIANNDEDITIEPFKYSLKDIDKKAYGILKNYFDNEFDQDNDDPDEEIEVDDLDFTVLYKIAISKNDFDKYTEDTFDLYSKSWNKYNDEYYRGEVDKDSGYLEQIIDLHKSDFEDYKDSMLYIEDEEDDDYDYEDLEENLTEKLDKDFFAKQQRLTSVQDKAVEAQDPTYANASRQMEKANELKAEFVKMEEAPQHEEHPKRPKMVPEAKKMHLDENLFEELTTEAIYNNQIDEFMQRCKKLGIKEMKDVQRLMHELETDDPLDAVRKQCDLLDKDGVKDIK